MKKVCRFLTYQLRVPEDKNKVNRRENIFKNSGKMFLELRKFSHIRNTETNHEKIIKKQGQTPKQTHIFCSKMTKCQNPHKSLTGRFSDK